MNDEATPTPATLGIQSSGAACTHCRSPLTDHYFEVNGARLCDPCTGSLQQHLTGTGSSLGRFFKAALFGIGAMLVGALAYGLWMGFTNSEFALVTIGIGWFVGKAVRHGSGNRGGWRYGVLAVLLTYAAISFSFLGVGIGQLRDERRKAPAADIGKPKESKVADASVTPATGESSDPDDVKGAPTSPVGLVAALVGLVVVSFTLPVASATQSILSLVITAFGLWQAWKMNRGVDVSISGPHPLTPTVPV